MLKGWAAISPVRWVYLMSDVYTIPEMELTPEPDGSVRITMTTGHSGAKTDRTRSEARRILMDLGLGIPRWLYPELD